MLKQENLNIHSDINILELFITIFNHAKICLTSFSVALSPTFPKARTK